MLNLNIGPFNVQVAHLLMLAALLVAVVVGKLVARGAKLNIGGALTDMVLAALLLGRVVFVALWFELYRRQPWSAFDVRDGGLTPWAALAGALAVGVWHCYRQPALRQPLVAAVGAGLLAWFFSGANTMLAAARQPLMPAIALRTLSGLPATLPGLALGKPAVVNLWASWCGPCRHEMPVLAAAQARDADIAYIFVNQGEDAGAAAPYLGQLQPTLSNVLLDPRAQLGKSVGSSALPTTLFYDAGGKLVDLHLGTLSEATLASRLQRLRAQRPK
ncbi:thiol-disulfide isomerase/thioredoxin [Janthinobacterium sp. CG_23.3]|uniref:TlpA family protein disulfide reductase n=1 Tax=unclassified Janthinobacterium TaxID=2610881 RepID=UPI0003459964|nr:MULTISPECIES: TlpA disulfide reductase family protein [unclassified Janthinobacterium]MEC5160722.1 thiol-disulfide isomerase/thioredoxin [Janthinobacterium sp. CG_S6]